MCGKGFYGRTKVRLATLVNVRSEMATVYRSAVRGEVTWQDAAKAAYVLNMIAQLDQGLVVAERVAVIEATIAAVKANGGARPGVHP
jgi:hypothetical protein